MKRLAVALGACILLIVPLSGFVGDYYVNLCSQVLIACIYALSLNLLVGYCGLTSLGHAAYLGIAAYISGWFTSVMGVGHLGAALLSVGGTTVLAAFFGLIALRASGLGFLMITLAIGQIFWGIAYRWVNLTGGDNGLTGLTRPLPFGIDLNVSSNFYGFTLVVFVCSFLLIALLVRSPFGACMRGTRDQPRRMSALGHNVWLIRWITFVLAGFWGAVSGLMYVYYYTYISPHTLSLTSSAEVLLMVIAGGGGTLIGPMAGATLVMLLKYLVSAYVERWLMLLGVVFVMIVIFMPDGLVPGVTQWWTRRNATPAPKQGEDCK
ncbi:MAG: branched-chain amino acid ABC transporter permease [Syntrophales bacterium]